MRVGDPEDECSPPPPPSADLASIPGQLDPLLLPPWKANRFNREYFFVHNAHLTLSLPSASVYQVLQWQAFASMPGLASPALATKSWFNGKCCSWWLFVGQVGRLLFLTGRDRPPVTLSAGHCPTVFPLPPHTHSPNLPSRWSLGDYL